MALCESHYDFHPEKDGQVTAAEKLGQQTDNWDMVWRRFAEAPASYVAIPDRLREAKPQMTLPLLDHSESWPQNNEAAETALRDALVGLSEPRFLMLLGARFSNWSRTTASGEAGYGLRLGSAPLAQAIEHLATMARVTESMAWGTSVSQRLCRSYADDRMGC